MAGRKNRTGQQHESGQQNRTGQQPVVWDRPEPTSRPTPSPLSRERIVRTAIELADEGGLAAVSLRKVASALDAGPMRLYGYLSTKDELLELMADQVYGEITPPEPAGEEWRVVLRTLAHNTRTAAHEHEWFVELLGGRPHVGPNALAFHEKSLSALDDALGPERIDTAMRAVGAVNAYVIGALSSEITELRSERNTGMDKSQWQYSYEPYMRRMLASGAYPTLAKVFDEAVHPPMSTTFETGLEYVLDGIAARLRE